MMMNLFSKLCLLGAFLTATAQAEILFTITDTTLVASDPTQLGRLSRDGIPSDWSGAKAFPGVINTTTSYHYHTYVIPVFNAPFVQITVDDPLAAIFASAYVNSYNPSSLSTNYLGDAGSSGNFFGVDPAFFQVVVPAFSNLVLVINDPAAANGGLNKQFSLVVEGFADTDFNDPPALPEPAAIVLSGSGLLAALVLGARRRLFAKGGGSI
jgi:hypothetical protein